MRRQQVCGPATAAAIALLGLAILVPAPQASAQGSGIEITPTISFRWGGQLKADDNALLDVDADVSSGVGYGLTIDVPVTRHFQIELLADHQEAALRSGELFAPDLVNVGLDLTYYHIGMLWQWYPRHAQPFVVFSIGATELDPEVPGVSGDTRFSASLGGGVKVPISENVAFRLEFRAFGTDTDQWGRAWDDDDEWWGEYCDDHDCDWHNDDLGQASVRAGVTFSF